MLRCGLGTQFRGEEPAGVRGRLAEERSQLHVQCVIRFSGDGLSCFLDIRVDDPCIGCQVYRDRAVSQRAVEVQDGVDPGCLRPAECCSPAGAFPALRFKQPGDSSQAFRLQFRSFHGLLRRPTVIRQIRPMPRSQGYRRAESSVPLVLRAAARVAGRSASSRPAHSTGQPQLRL